MYERGIKYSASIRWLIWFKGGLTKKNMFFSAILFWIRVFRLKKWQEKKGKPEKAIQDIIRQDMICTRSGYYSVLKDVAQHSLITVNKITYHCLTDTYKSVRHNKLWYCEMDVPWHDNLLFVTSCILDMSLITKIYLYY